MTGVMRAAPLARGSHLQGPAEDKETLKQSSETCRSTQTRTVRPDPVSLTAEVPEELMGLFSSLDSFLPLPPILALHQFQSERQHSFSFCLMGGAQMGREGKKVDQVQKPRLAFLPIFPVLKAAKHWKHMHAAGHLCTSWVKWTYGA